MICGAVSSSSRTEVRDDGTVQTTGELLMREDTHISFSFPLPFSFPTSFASIFLAPFDDPFD